MMRRLIDQSGYATVRMDKPGVGESQGTPCNKADYQGELEGYQAAFDAMNKYDFIDTKQIFVVGLSNGGGVGPLVSRDHAVAGFVAASSWGRTWYEHMLENERVRLTTEKKSPAEVNDAVKAFTQFYDSSAKRPAKSSASTRNGNHSGTMSQTVNTVAQPPSISSFKR